MSLFPPGRYDRVDRDLVVRGVGGLDRLDCKLVGKVGMGRLRLWGIVGVRRKLLGLRTWCFVLGVVDEGMEEMEVQKGGRDERGLDE